MYLRAKGNNGNTGLLMAKPFRVDGHMSTHTISRSYKSIIQSNTSGTTGTQFTSFSNPATREQKRGGSL